ncbi:thioesterase II family protein [Amycolatopsis plumensis]|uniref:Thioesterase II family protein n=1 Tax=Amycolatopsis plumensis TaxID=236508 RepID=A0ABV5UDJ8_9PSEU
MTDRPPHPETTASGTGAWLRRYRAAPTAHVRLICFPHAGGSASYFMRVARQLPPKIDVLAVQYPGRQDRRHEPCVEDIGGLADRILPELLPLADRPLALFGHSMGAAVAFETARRLEENGVEPKVLFASSRPSPATVLGGNLHRSGDQALIAEMRRLNATAADVLEDPAFLDMVLPVLRSDYTAVETYRCRPTHAAVACPVVALAGDDDPQAPQADCLRWKEHTRGQFDLHVFAGGHFYLDDHADAVLRIVTERLT